MQTVEKSDLIKQAEGMVESFDWDTTMAVMRFLKWTHNGEPATLETAKKFALDVLLSCCKEFPEEEWCSFASGGFKAYRHSESLDLYFTPCWSSSDDLTG